MDKDDILKKFDKHGVKVDDKYFRPSKTECSAFEQCLKIMDDQSKKLAAKPKDTHVPLVNLNPSPLKKIPEV